MRKILIISCCTALLLPAVITTSYAQTAPTAESLRGDYRAKLKGWVTKTRQDYKDAAGSARPMSPMDFLKPQMIPAPIQSPAPSIAPAPTVTPAPAPSSSAPNPYR